MGCRSRAGLRAFALLWVAWAVGFSAFPVEAQTEQPRRGGVLRVAMIGEPPSLDLHWTTAIITHEIMWHTLETLYALNARYEPVPHLAEGHEVYDGGRRYLIQLRPGVKFHNGKEMTSADVVASLQRWGRLSTPGKVLFKTLEALEAKGPSAVEFRFKEPSGILIDVLARPNNDPAIYPKEVVEAAGDKAPKELIGTGPFRFVEHRPDRHIKMARFDGYAARPEPANGYAGRRVAYADELYFLPVPDAAVRLAGVETGEYQYAQQIKQDAYDRVRSLPGVDPVIVKPYGWPVAVFNNKQGLLTDRRLRQAFLAALDMEPIMAAAFGSKSFYRLDPSILQQEQAWHSRAGAALYNQRDKDKARRLLKEAGYQGQPLRWLTTQEYDLMYKTSLVAKQQLEEVGFKIDLQVVDWATLVQRRNKPELYDAFMTYTGPQFEPTTAAVVQCNWPGWWCHPEKDRLLDEMAKETDFKKRYAMWERVQALFYEEGARVKFGDFFLLDVKRKELRGVQPSPQLYLWNAWLDKR